MEKLLGQNDPKLMRYVDETFRPEDPVLAEIRERAARLGFRPIQVGKADALHLEVLTRAIGACKAVEIGTLAGYSGVAIARGLAPGGKLYTFENDLAHSVAARESFEKAGLADRVEIFQGDATRRLNEINPLGPFDLVFIDADKVSYPAYLAWASEHLRVGGVVLGDNTFGWGMIADTDFEDPADERAIQALREFNRELAQGGRFRSTLLPTGEGLTIGVKLR